MLSEFEKSIADFIKANGLFASADRILLAVSGGADSTALLYGMSALKDEGILNAELICAHINHQLRGTEAELDEGFVIAEAVKLNLDTITKRLDVRGFARKNKLSIETAGRKLRIESLLDIAKTNNCNCVATAHQKNDNAETVLQRLTRGTGFRGLGGIWPVRKFADDIQFVRPLLPVTREEIIEYLKRRGLKWRVDETNENLTYRRNFIRHRLIPALEQDCKSSVIEQLSDLSRSTQRFYSLVCSCAEQVWPGLADVSGDKLKLDLKIFLAQPQPVKVELVRRSLAALGCGEQGLAQQHYEKILRLAERKISGKRIELPGGFAASYEYGKLTFSREENKHIEKEKSKKIEVPGKTEFSNYLIEAVVFEPKNADIEKFKTEKGQFVECFDFDRVKLPLTVRFRKEGDRFWPLGLAAEKRIGKFLTAVKVPQEVRRKLLIIADSEKIIWVWPIRMCEQAKITNETRKVLQIRTADSI